MKKIIILSILAIGLSGCTKIQNISNISQNQNTNSFVNQEAQQNTNENIPPENDDTVFCTMDAKLCPDGSYVGRIPPECNFAPCPETKETKLYQPIAEFKDRISKKPFGIYITPKDSPVQPEKFSGYHTGADVEYDDKPEEKINVYAIADGEVVRSGWVSGYGGMLAIRHKINDKNYIVIYGHLTPGSLPKVNSSVAGGQTIGYLGKGYSNETDGERKHLHLAIYTGTDTNVRGYVTTKKELEKWIDPVSFIQ